jgi:hypothetical protein
MAMALYPTPLSNELQELLMCDSIIPGEQPSYALCKLLYTSHVLGEKIASAPIRMAQSQKREITVPAGPEDRLKEQFEKQWEEDGASKNIANTMKLARVYGIASLALLADGIDPDVPLGSPQFQLESLWKQDVSWNIFDPLNTAGSLVLNQNPNAMDFQKTCNISVNGKVYHKSRSVIILNEDPVYINYTVSAFGFVGRSCYQRALFPLKTFINSLVTDDMVVRKVGVLVAKQKSPGSVLDNVMLKIAGVKRSIIKEAQTTNVISIGTEEAIESLNLQNLEAPYMVARKNMIENIASGVPMPAKLLLQETFAEGFGEGTEDAKYIAQYIDDVREQMQPLYNFMDRIIKRRAWNPDFYKLIQADFPEQYGNVPYNTAFYRWDSSYKAMWPSLLKEPPSERVKVDDVKLRAALYLFEVFSPVVRGDPDNMIILIGWLQDQFNEIKELFHSAINFDFDTLRSALEEAAKRAEESAEAGIEEGEAKKFPGSFSDSQHAAEYRDAVDRLTSTLPRRLRKVVEDRRRA